MTRYLNALTASLPASVPFTGPETLERRQGRAFRARLGANENGFGPSPKAIEAMAEAASGVWMYGDPESYDLKTALAAHHGCQSANIVVGQGIDGLLGLLCRLTLGKGDKVVTSLGGYPTLIYHAVGFGAEVIRVPYRGAFEDPEALLQAVRTSGAKMVYLANPDNPMGSHHSGAVIENLLAQLPETCLLVLDEAYIDLAPHAAQANIAPEHPGVIRFRTFSKGYGLAGARVGYAIGAPDLIAAFDRVRDHFGMCRISQAGALAALADQEWAAHIRASVIAARNDLSGILAQNGLRPLPSATNFVTSDCGRDGDYARRILAAAQDLGLFIRMPGVAPLDVCIRISLGPKADMDLVAELLPQILRAADKA